MILRSLSSAVRPWNLTAAVKNQEILLKGSGMMRKQQRKATPLERKTSAKARRPAPSLNMPGERSVTSLNEQIAETEATIRSLKSILHEAMREIRENGDEVTVQVCDRNGKRIEKQRSNPALKRTREVAANIRSLRRYRADLLEELAEMKKSRTVEQNVDALDELLKEEPEPKSVDALDELLNEGDKGND